MKAQYIVSGKFENCSNAHIFYIGEREEAIKIKTLISNLTEGYPSDLTKQENKINNDTYTTLTDLGVCLEVFDLDFLGSNEDDYVGKPNAVRVYQAFEVA